MEDGIVPGVSVQLDKESKAFHGFLMGRELECGFCVGLVVVPPRSCCQWGSIVWVLVVGGVSMTLSDSGVTGYMCSWISQRTRRTYFCRPRQACPSVSVKKPKLPYKEARHLEDIRPPRAVFFNSVMALG